MNQVAAIKNSLPINKELSFSESGGGEEAVPLPLRLLAGTRKEQGMGILPHVG